MTEAQGKEKYCLANGYYMENGQTSERESCQSEAGEGDSSDEVIKEEVDEEDKMRVEYETSSSAATKKRLPAIPDGPP